MLSIVAYLQNPWFKPGTSDRLIEMYRTDQRVHRMVLALSATGRALEKALGPNLYRDIWWDNANWRHGDTRDSVIAADPVHMANVIRERQPEVVVLFGRQAQMGHDLIPNRLPTYEVITAPHPMARGSSKEHLAAVAHRLRMLYGSN